jgi:X-Pro dipeptidyl-peptidase
MRLVLAVLVLLVAPASASAAVVKQEIRVPMRDGVELAVDLYLPTEAQNGEHVPVILTLTPYHELYKGLGDGASLDGYRFTSQGYAFAVADVRGTYESGGCWDYGGQLERYDGYDLVEWLGTQPFSNGKVAMIGASYDGTTANAAAIEQPPHLATIVPISSISRWYGYAFNQGVRRTYSGDSADIDPPGDTPTDFMFAYGFLPPPEPGSLGAATQIAQRWTPCDRADQTAHGYATQPDYDDFWKERDYLQHADKVHIPVLVTHGLQDYNVNTWEGTQWFEALPGEKAMIIGQWGHAIPTWENWDDFLDRWFARWLKGEANGVENEPAVVVQGTDDEFRFRERWSGTGTRSTAIGEGTASFFDDGALTESEMLQGACGSRCLSLKLPSLAGVHVMGRPKLHLRFQSDQPSTHFVAVLLDAGGEVISRGFMNARYRNGLEKGEDLVPGQPAQATLELIDKEHAFSEGGAELILASSSTTWVLSDERRANNTIDLGASILEIPTDGPEPGGTAAPAQTAPAPPPAVTPKPCRRKVTIRLPRRARGKKLVVRVNGKRVRALVRGRRLTVKVPRGRAVIKVRGRGVKVTRRVRACR